MWCSSQKCFRKTRSLLAIASTGRPEIWTVLVAVSFLSPAEHGSEVSRRIWLEVADYSSQLSERSSGAVELGRQVGLRCRCLTSRVLPILGSSTNAITVPVSIQGSERLGKAVIYVKNAWIGVGCWCRAQCRITKDEEGPPCGIRSK